MRRTMCTTWRSLRREIVWRLQRWIRVFLYWIYVYDGVFVVSFKEFSE